MSLKYGGFNIIRYIIIIITSANSAGERLGEDECNETILNIRGGILQGTMHAHTTHVP